MTKHVKIVTDPSGTLSEFESGAMAPNVTVCIPVYNGELTLRRTLDTILSQDYPNISIIISDNNSTDKTGLIAREYSKKGLRYHLNPLKGQSAESNWNYALRLASSPLIALYHADDLYMPIMVRRQVEFLQAHPDASAVFTNTRRIDDQDRPIRWGSTSLPEELRGQSGFAFPELFNAVLKYGNIMMVPTLMLRRETLEAVGDFNYQKFHSAADIDLFLRMSRWRPIGIIDEPLHRYRIHSSNWAMQNRLRVFRSHFLLVMDYYLSDPNFHQNVKPESLFYYGMHSLSDDILRAANLVALGYSAQARSLLDSLCTRSVFRSGLLKPLFSRKFFLGFFLSIGLHLGLGAMAGRVYRDLYQPWRLRRRISPLTY